MAARLKINKNPLLTLKKLGLFSTSDAKKQGVSRLDLYRLAADNKIKKIGSGIFYHPDFELQGEELDYATASLALRPESVIGGLTALFHYRLTEEAPKQIWVLIPRKKRSWNKRYRCMRTTTSLKTEVEDHGTYRLVTLERALLEALKYSTKIGLETALSANRKAIHEKLTTIHRLQSAGKRLHLTRVLQKYWEAIIA